jgi:hypothetical protein
MLKLLKEFLTLGITFLQEKLIGSPEKIDSSIYASAYLRKYADYFNAHPAYYVGEYVDLNYKSTKEYVEVNLMGELIFQQNLLGFEERLYVISNVDSLSMVVLYSKLGEECKTVSFSVISDALPSESSDIDQMMRVVTTAHALSNTIEQPTQALG